MDEKTALNILHLDATVTLEQAKKAYRNLAKQYHPDVNPNTSLLEKNADAKMKDINLAFRYLAPLLISKEPARTETRPKTVHKKPITSEKVRWDSFLSEVTVFLTGFFQRKSRPETFDKEKEHSPQKRGGIQFDDVFRRVRQGSLNRGEKTGKLRKKKDSNLNRPVNDYGTYMALKRKMESGRYRRDPDRGGGRVNKIEPITPVNRVGKN